MLVMFFVLLSQDEAKFSSLMAYFSLFVLKIRFYTPTDRGSMENGQISLLHYLLVTGRGQYEANKTVFLFTLKSNLVMTQLHLGYFKELQHS